LLFSSRPSRGGGPYGVVDAYDLGGIGAARVINGSPAQ
jgi:hypothetical protein